jgi:hypothetical protein
MKKSIFTFCSMLLLVATILTFSGCQKDETTNGVLPRSVMIIGEWKLTDYTENNISVLADSLPGVLSCDNGTEMDFVEIFTFDPFYWSIKKDTIWSQVVHTNFYEIDVQTSEVNCEPIYFKPNTEIDNSEGSWHLSEDGNTLMITDYTMGFMMNYTLKQLGPSQMELEFLSGTNVYHLNFQKR